eukprot:TRINITY_DN4012_c0_g1_i1.p2 TRINITY_DN4012_c0_g1~~TRINITY_DN4012_c0_g1_i1.p2  ORF type:complete len:133 (-),score=21.00 TRINITY_DN4012_c0_g1_i1:67-465(-)
MSEGKMAIIDREGKDYYNHSCSVGLFYFHRKPEVVIISDHIPKEVKHQILRLIEEKCEQPGFQIQNFMTFKEVFSAEWIHWRKSNSPLLQYESLDFTYLDDDEYPTYAGFAQWFHINFLDMPMFPIMKLQAT